MVNRQALIQSLFHQKYFLFPILPSLEVLVILIQTVVLVDLLILFIDIQNDA